MQSKQFSEGPYFAGYEAIRDQFRSFDAVVLISRCVEYLHKPFADPMEYYERHPWCALLLIKWILVDENFEERNRPAPTREQAIKLIRRTIDLGGKARRPSQYDHARLFMRAIATQQIIFQRAAPITLTARQMHYFSALSEDHYIPRAFYQVTGLSLNRFLELSLVFHAAFIEDKRFRNRIGAHWFGNLAHGANVADIDKFLSLLSAPLASIRDALLARDGKTIEAGRVPRAASEYSELTPFVQTPLLPLTTGDYLVLNPCLLEHCLANFVYYTLRRRDVDGFMDPFGKIFENYVQLAVNYTRLEYRSEGELKTLLRVKKGRSLIDFVIADGDAHVFIDAKAAEMNYRGTITSDADELTKLLDTSLLKAIRQANSVIADLARLNSADVVFRPRSHKYLIVVMYAKMYIGSGPALADSVGMSAIEAQIADHPGGLQIPIQNMYFLTIQEFECLVAHVAAGSIGLVEALERAKASDVEPLDRVFTFEQHLAKWDMWGAAPNYLIKMTQQALAKVGQIMRN